MSLAMLAAKTRERMLASRNESHPPQRDDSRFYLLRKKDFRLLYRIVALQPKCVHSYRMPGPTNMQERTD
jgi:hypothetical protein